jgi:hypothetical protein
MELNPNHPATQGVHDHWHKICALIMLKMGLTTLTISPNEIEKLGDCVVNIAIRFDDTKGIELFIIDDLETAKIMARREGGLPV